MSLRVLYSLHRLGIRPDLLDIGRSTSMARYSRYRRHYLRFDPDESRNHASFAEFVERYVRKNAIDAIIAADIPAAGAVHEIKALVQKVIVYPVSDAYTLELLDDKWRFQEFMESHDIPCPRGLLLLRKEDIERVSVEKLGFPFVCKPLSGESSHGVAVISSREQLRSHVSMSSRHHQPPLLLQEMVEGFDADLSVLAVGGEIHAHVLQSRRDPSSLEFIEDEQVLEIGRKIVKVANYSGVANIDVRIDEKSGAVKVLECNPRFWYTLGASLWRGLNFVEVGLELAAGRIPQTSTVVGGRYYRHKDLVERIVTLKWARPPRVNSYNIKGLLQAITDPLPFILQKMR